MWQSGLRILLENYSHLKETKIYLDFFNVLFRIFKIKYQFPKNTVTFYPQYIYTILQITTWPEVSTHLQEPQHWGRFIWSLIHFVSTMWNKEQSKDFARFIVLIAKILPCRSCRLDFAQLLQTVDLSEPQTCLAFVNLIIALHFNVNLKVEQLRKIKYPQIYQL
jgi:hypothetical protein